MVYNIILYSCILSFYALSKRRKRVSLYDPMKNVVPPSETARQNEYAALVRTVLDSRFSDTPRAFVHTYGCQGNVSDGERMKGLLRACGFTFTDTPDDADLVLYNTCAVREHAQDRVFGNVGVRSRVLVLDSSLVSSL